MINLFAAIPRVHRIAIDNGVAKLSPFPQKTNMTQWDNLSLLLFSVMLKGSYNQRRETRKFVEIILHVDGVMIYGTNRFQAQLAWLYQL